MGCSVWSADAEILFPAGINLSKKTDDAGQIG